MNTTMHMRFQKIGRAKYISHLDLMRCFQRAICRAELPAAYSEGFHPRMLTVFAAALPLGLTSCAEVLELGLTQALSGESVRQRLNQVLPEGIRILKAGDPCHAFRELAQADYRIRIEAEDSTALRESFGAFAAQPEIRVEKKTKRGIREVDLKAAMQILSLEEQAGELTLCLRLPAGSSENVSPLLIADAWQQYSGTVLSVSEICRTALLAADGTAFF